MINSLARSCLVLSLLFVARSALAQETAGGSANPFAQAKFVPDISLVMDVSYAHRNLRDASFAELHIPGFSHINVTQPAYEHEGLNTHRGFNLNYAELVLSSVVDPYFDLFVVCHLGEESFDIEEAYFSTRRLPWGLQVKGGKFLSHFGRLNAQHTHQWDFTDSPLIYAALFGESTLNEKGIRLTWVAPIDTYLMLGGEALQGENSMSFGHAGFSDQTGSIDVKESKGPNVLVAYAKSSLDMGNATFLFGVSNAYGRTRSNDGLEYGGPSSQAQYCRTDVAGIDMTIKYLVDSIRYWSLQAEYLYRDSHGDHYQMEESGSIQKRDIDRDQGGFYAQVVGRFSKRLRLGIRYDLIHLNDVEVDHVMQAFPENLPRLSAMAEYNPTEFSRVRLQYNHDQSRYETGLSGYSRRANRELILQVNLAIGAHGAHAF